MSCMWPEPDVQPGDLIRVMDDGVESWYLVLERTEAGPGSFELTVLPDWEPAPEDESR